MLLAAFCGTNGRMEALKRSEVEAIALLARLELADSESERLRGELTAILEHIESLSNVDTTDVEPMTHAVPMKLRLRQDAAEPSLPVEVALDQAPDSADDSFRVPHIISSGT